MTIRNTAFLLILLTSAFLLGATVFSFQPVQEPEGMPSMPEPTKHHKLMQAGAGTWDAEMKMGGMLSKGQETNTVTCGGMWMQTKFTGEFGGMPFEGRGIQGYDTKKGKYVTVWVDNFTDYLSIGEGEFSKDGKVFTSVMIGRNPETGEDYKQKMTDTYHTKDHRTLAMFNKGEDGEWVQTMTIEYKRRK